MTKKKFLFMGIAIGAASIVLVGAACTPTTPSPTPVPTTQPEPTPTYNPGDDSVYEPSTGDCGPDAYRIEPGVCEQLPAPEIGGAMQLAYCETETSTFCYWDASIQGNGQGQSFVNTDNFTYYLP